MRRIKSPILALSFTLFGGMAYAQTDSTDNAVSQTIVEQDLFDFSLEDLLKMEVTSVSKKSERLQDVASSIYVVTSEDIKNSGATNLHEALRLVPGYWGTQDQYNSVTPMIRNSPVSNGSKGTVLYLLDGTPIQDNMSSTFSFSNFDIPLDEIDRIEVIRGSGGTIYGANSATGVVNIFTKSPDKYDGISARAEVANPNYSNVTVRAGGKITEKLSVSGYAKARHFGGYGMVNEIDKGNGDTLYVLKKNGTDRTTVVNRFKEDYETTNMFSAGLKAAYKLNDNSKFTFNSHYNTTKQTEYTNFDTRNMMLGASDSLVTNKVKRDRLVANVRYDHNFSEAHSIFARVSTNVENDFLKTAGGYKVNNSIVDIELQDNISLGKLNDISFGVNYRTVNFDVNGVNDKLGVNYIDPKNSETLKGGFIQDKFKLFEGKLNLLVGIKGENYSLINNKYYLSPMAKITYIPTQNLTFWGGFTQSYTTPGYNNTNIDLMFLKRPADETITGLATQGVYQNVYEKTYEGAVLGGATTEQAAVAAKGAADGFVASPVGQETINATSQGINSQFPNNIGVVNGTNTVPTKYQTYEVGVRTTLDNMVSFETNIYYSNISDAISPSNSVVNQNAPSLSNPGVIADYYYYGNYLKGITYGLESMIKIIPSKGSMFEISYVYNKSTWEFQKNSDFDISLIKNIDETPKTPVMPYHVIRLKSSFKLPKNFVFSADILVTSVFSTQANYDFENQRYPNIIGDEEGTRVATNNSRTIFNFKLQKNLFNDNLNVYVFGNDLLNPGIIASTNSIASVTLSKIGPMAGVGAIYKF